MDDDQIGMPIVLASSMPGKPVGLLFSSHYDVVGVNTEKWETDPFQAVLRDGRIYGRGATDAKGLLSAMVSAYEALSQMDMKPKRNLEFIFTGDEEFGGRRGVRSRIMAGRLTSEGCIVGEPVHIDCEFKVCVMTKGRAEVCVVVHREKGMSSHPGLARKETPLDKLVSILHCLRNSEKRLIEVFEPLEMQEAEWNSLTRHVPQVHILDISQYSEAASGNITGSCAEGRVEIRYHPPLRLDDIEKWLNEILAEHIESTVTYTLTSWNEPGSIKANSGLHRAVIDLAAAAGFRFKPAAFPAGSDMSALINIHKLPTCIASCANLQANHIHDDNEFITEHELIQSIILYAALMLGYDGVPMEK